LSVGFCILSFEKFRGTFKSSTENLKVPQNFEKFSGKIESSIEDGKVLWKI